MASITHTSPALGPSSVRQLPLTDRSSALADPALWPDMHEVAVCSGFAAAYRLGAKYPFAHSDEARRMFALVLGVNHGVRLRKQDRSGVVM